MPALSQEEYGRRRRAWPVVVPPVTVLAVFVALAFGPPPTPTRLLAAGVVVASVVGSIALVASAQNARAREATRDALHRTAAGDLTISRRELRRSGDPELARALHGLLVGMERILTSFVRLSEAVSGVARELSVRGRDLSLAASAQAVRAEETALAIERTDAAIGSLRMSMETLGGAAENAGASLHEMSASITQVSMGAEGLRAYVDETADALGLVLTSLGEVAAAVENLARLADETAQATAILRGATQETDRQTNTAARLAERVSRAVRDGKSAVSGTALGMSAIRESVASASAAATALGERSERIGEILRVIEEIAGETNLLALNASIIAAQAGESSRAFSGLVEDIRDLSDRTSASTEEVRGLVGAVRGGVGDVRKQLAAARRQTDEGVDLARTADATLDDIESLTAESRKSSEGVAAAAAQQAAGIARVSDATTHVSEEVERIHRASRSQVETARTVAARGEKVRELAEQLSRAMEEQASGSRALLASMEGVTRTVEDIAQATATLAEGSASVVGSMEGIRQATAQNAFAASAMNQTAMSLEQEALTLNLRSSVFRFPAAAVGGRVRAALRYLRDEDFDPAFAWTIPQATLVKTWGEGLVRFAEGTRVVPELAERWEVDPTGTLYTFHLRRGVKFQDGSAFSSHDVKASFERLLSPEMGAPLAGLFDAIEGAPGLRLGNSPSASGIETPDAATVSFRLDRPLPFFLQLLTLPDATVLAPASLAREKARLSPSGTGPFLARELRFGKSARFDRFDSYWDRAHVALEGLDLDLTEDSEAGVFERFMDGRLDVIWDVPYLEAARLQADPEWRPYIDSSVQLHTSFVALRCDRAPLDDVRVRRALNLAVDRGRLNERFFSGLTVPASSILPPHLLGHDLGLRPYGHEPERARTLLAEAGHRDGLDLTAWQTPKDSRDPQNLLTAVASDLAAVGVRVRVEVLSGEEMAARKKGGQFPSLYLTRWFADFPDPDTFFNSLFYSHTDDVTELGFRDAELDRLVEKGARATDGHEREAIYRQLNRLVQQEAPVLFLFHNRGFVLHRPSVRGVRAFLLPPPVRWADLSFEG